MYRGYRFIRNVRNPFRMCALDWSLRALRRLPLEIHSHFVLTFGCRPLFKVPGWSSYLRKIPSCFVSYVCALLSVSYLYYHKSLCYLYFLCYYMDFFCCYLDFLCYYCCYPKGCYYHVCYSSDMHSNEYFFYLRRYCD